MNYQFLSANPVECYPSPIEGAEPVYLNPSNKHFALLKQLSLEEVRNLIDEYADLRMESGWHSLMNVSARTGKHISFFNNHKNEMTRVNTAVVLCHFGFTANFQIIENRKKWSVEEQRRLVAPLKPKTKAEMLALFANSHEDESGYMFLKSLADKSTSGTDFFGRLIDDLFIAIVKDEERRGKPGRHATRARTLEFLSLAASKGWLLFPFLNYEGTEPVVNILINGWHFNNYFQEIYRPTEAGLILDDIAKIEFQSNNDEKIQRSVCYLLLCSTFRTYDQVSKEFLERALDLVIRYSMPEKPESSATAPGLTKKVFNAVLRLRNSKIGKFPSLQPISVGRGAKTIDDYVSFQYLRDEYPNLSTWANQFEEWIKSSVDTQHQLRKAACSEFANFLVTLPDPPTSPNATLRRNINDTTSVGNTFRNHLARVLISPQVRNTRLTMVSQFFQFVADITRRADNTSWFPNPIDIRFDRFDQEYRGQGSPRKAIGSHIMETMRQILIEDDYAWSKARTSWGHLVDKQTGRLEYVWCPSEAILLYLLLSVPIRGLQGRMLDSGQGDSEIYDFDLERIIPNPNQLLVDGKLDATRREGILQVMPSGMVGGEDILGLWITTNKTSGEGYFIPWVSGELLTQLKYQRDWLFRYADIPNMHNITAGQGKRSVPAELEGIGGKYYCLFQDVFAQQVHDHSLPVAKQKTSKLWGKLCLETQNRMNAKAEVGNRIMLVESGTENDTNPKAIHDVHSLRISGITDLLDRGVPLNIVSEYVAGHATYIMTLWYDKPAPGAIRKHLQEAQKMAGQMHTSLPSFTQEELIEHKPYLVGHHQFADFYNGFDALEENRGLATIRHSGICPGTRCSEGALDDRQRASPVPFGDRGPSCPQCRFWLTGPAFLLGQTIEGNQLIFKIRSKIESLTKIREKVMDAEDAGMVGQAEIFRGQQDVEERQLNDMLTEWWHRMRFYEASRQKLAAYRASLKGDQQTESNQGVTVFPEGDALPEPDWAVSRATELELKHFLSTCAEFLPEGTLDAQVAKQDIEIAVAKFLAINGKGDLAAMLFTLDEDERLTAANLTVELLLSASKDPEHATLVLEGKEKMDAIPNLQRGIEYLYGEGLTKTLKAKIRGTTKGLKHEDN